jgi:hypothetical protein
MSPPNDYWNKWIWRRRRDLDDEGVFAMKRGSYPAAVHLLGDVQRVRTRVRGLARRKKLRSRCSIRYKVFSTNMSIICR